MRSYIRHPSDIPIEYQEDKQDAGVSQERLNDISKGGLSFSSAKELSPGRLITIRFSCVQPDFEARAQVVWCHREAGGYVIGVVFKESSELSRVRMIEQIFHIRQYRADDLATEGRQHHGEQAASQRIHKLADDIPNFEDAAVS